MSNKDEKKAESERESFKRFASANGWPTDTNLIESRKAPEPDILYHLPSGKIAFELAEYCDPDVALQAADPNSEDAKWVGGPPAKSLKKKLTRSYKSKFPLELLFYWSGRVVETDDMAVPKLKHLFDNKFTGNKFRRVWYSGEKGVFQIFEADS